MWVSVLGSFEKLHEVGVLSYLFYPLFKCFVMLVLREQACPYWCSGTPARATALLFHE